MATLIEATATMNAQNAALEGEPMKVVLVEVYPNYQLDNYATTMIPSKYEVQYSAATLEQKYAFARVHQATVLNGYSSTADYVTQYDVQAALDSVLSVYLGL